MPLLENAMMPPHTGQMVAAAWEKYVGSTPQDNVLDLRRREIGFKANPITGPVSWETQESPPAYLPTASLQCIHDWERHVARYLWTCKQCGEEITEFDIATGRMRKV